MSPKAPPPMKTVVVSDPSSLRIAGRLSRYRSKWRSLEKPRWVSHLMEDGFKFRFHTPPCQPYPPRQFPLPSADRLFVDEELSSMLAHGACREILPSARDYQVSGEFILTLFVVHQGEKNRVVFNYPPLNDFCNAPHFKMENLKDARASVLPGDFAVKGDFHKAYWGIRLHPDHRKYCRFMWKGRKFELLTLSFGISIAPFLFDAVMNVAVRELRRRGLRLVYYLDDWLVLHRDPVRCARHAQEAVDLFSSLGFVLHPGKTSSTPSQRFQFLGIEFDTVLNRMRIPRSKERDIRRNAEKILRRPTGCSPTTLASLLGKIAFAAQVSMEARLRFLVMEWTKVGWLKANPSWDALHPLPQKAVKEIQWWARLDHRLAPCWIHPLPPNEFAAGDAGPLGWGATTGSSLTGPRSSLAERWTREETLWSTNVREMETLRRTLRIWGKRWTGRRVRWKTDSAVAFSYLRKIHGRFPHLVRLARKIHRLLRRYRIDMSFELVPGAEIPEEDNLSRLADRHDYALTDRAFQRIARLLGRPRCDLFASRFTARAPKFFSRRPDPRAAAVDAFAQSWKAHKLGLALAFAPPLLLRRVIQKAAWEENKCMFISRKRSQLILSC